MAVNHIIYNYQLPHSQRLRAFLVNLDSVFAEGNDILAILSQMKDGGNVGQYIADKFGFGLLSGALSSASGDVAIAQAAVAEIESLMAKLNTTGSDTTSNVKDAIKQAIAKFG